YGGRRCFLSADGMKGGGFLLPRLLKRCRGVTLCCLSLIELLGRHIGLPRERPKPVSGACRKLEVRLRTLDLLGCNRRVRFLRRDGAPPRVKRAHGNPQIGLGLLDGEAIRHRVNTKKKIALRYLGILSHWQFDDSATDRRSDVNDIGIDRGVVRGWTDRDSVLDVDHRCNTNRDDRERDYLAARRTTGRAGRLHAHCPNQASQAIAATTRPSDEQTKSWYGRMLLSPKATKRLRAAIAPKIPIMA